VILLAALAALAACSPPPRSLSVAVAANFTEPSKEIARLFELSTGYTAVMSFGSTGQLFAQITQEAPFEVFLAADQETPRKAIEAGLAVEETLTTYAVGRIVLFSAGLDLSDGAAVLRGGQFGRIAVANPSTAPYGRAALETLQALGIEDELRGKIAQGNNISQTLQFVETGNAELGFVAQSQVTGKPSGSMWLVPESLHSPIRQDAVLLKKGAGNAAAKAFMTFLKSPDGRKVVEKYGYMWPS
jgi:molybdate transport system substrate-binding protein